MKKITIYTEYITLGQLLKYEGYVSNGGEIKAFLSENFIKINGKSEKKRGKKLFPNDEIEIFGKKMVLSREKNYENEVNWLG